MDSNQEQISNKFRNLSFIAACLVVFIHLRTLPDDSSVGCRWFYRIVTNGICRVAVPFFFIASGYWLAKKLGDGAWNWQNYRDAVSKRIRTLVLPFFLWSGIFLAFVKGMQCATNIVAHRPLMHDILHGWSETLTWFGFDFTTVPYMVPLWYLRALVILVFVSPIFFYGIRKCWWITLAAVFAFKYCLGASIAQLGIGPFFFALGIWFNTSLGEKVLLFCLRFFSQLGGEWPKWLTSAAFPLYLIHWMVLCLYSIVVPNTWSFASWYGVMMKGVFGILLSLFLIILIRKIFPKKTKILFGGR